MGAFALTRAYHFSAAHRLASPALADADNARLYGQCFRVHGHNYRLEVTVEAPSDAVTGMAVDLGLVDRVVRATVLDRVDHYDLSTTVPALSGVVTTGENLARVFWEWLEPALPAGILRRVAIVETENNRFEWVGTAAEDVSR